MIQGNAPSPLTARNSAEESGTSSSGNCRSRSAFRTWLSTTVYQRKPGLSIAATRYHPKPRIMRTATPSHGSRADRESAAE